MVLFKDRYAFVGSSNMTKSALSRNDEINVRIDSSDPKYKELESIFKAYWKRSEYLEQEDIEHYQETYFKRQPKIKP